MPQISPYAIVECPANLADDVTVGPFACVGPDVRIGSGTRIENNVTLTGQVDIGRDNHVFPFAVIGQPAGEGQPAGRVVIGDRNSIREHVVICAGPAGTRIGSDNLIMIGCHLAGDAAVGDQVILGNFTQVAERSRVEDWVRTSGFTGTRPGTTIGAYTFTSGFAGIDRNAPPFAMVQGFPFRVRGVNAQNLKRCGFDESAIADLKDAFRGLFNGEGGPVDPELIEELASREPLAEPVRYLLDFLRRSGEPAADDGRDGSVGQTAEER